MERIDQVILGKLMKGWELIWDVLWVVESVCVLVVE